MELLTGNEKKYEQFRERLQQMGITIVKFKGYLPEIQATTLEAVTAAKAKAASEIMGRACLVDDVGLFLQDYPGFPGPFTKYALRTLKAEGFKRLLRGTANEALMVCIIGYWDGESLVLARGEMKGTLNPARNITNPLVPLNDWFIPLEGEQKMQHRANALQKLAEILEIEKRRRG